MRPGFGARTTCSAGMAPRLAARHAVAKPARASYRRGMLAWRRVSLVGPAGRLRAPAPVAAECGEQDGGVLLTAHRFGQGGPYARLLCPHLAAPASPRAAGSGPPPPPE